MDNLVPVVEFSEFEFEQMLNYEDRLREEDYFEEELTRQDVHKILGDS